MTNISEAQLKANRENAKHSTGPTSSEGKRKVALNPLTHGFAGQTVLIPAHEEDAYTKHFKDFRAEYKPKGPTEQFLVQSLAEISWSAQQIRAQITNLLSLGGAKCEPMLVSGNDQVDFAIAQATALEANMRKIELLGIYEQRKMRAFSNAQKELVALQTTRKAAEQEELEEACEYRLVTPGDWNPADDGFACSLTEVDRYIKVNRRRVQVAGGRVSS
jgi:hypothetical protein